MLRQLARSLKYWEVNREPARGFEPLTCGLRNRLLPAHAVSGCLAPPSIPRLIRPRLSHSVAWRRMLAQRIGVKIGVKRGRPLPGPTRGGERMR